MEINDYGDTRMGGVVVADTVEGRMVCLTSHTESRNYGSMTDLPGFKVPSSAAEAARSRYVVAFAQDNRSLPIYQPNPHYDWAMRYGFEQAENAPFSAEVYITHPGVQIGRTIPSGMEAVAFGEGTYTVESGSFTYSSTMADPGTQLEVDYSGAAAGKLKVYSAGGIVAEVVRFDSTAYKLTFKILH
jgi:hypothetical protein